MKQQVGKCHTYTVVLLNEEDQVVEAAQMRLSGGALVFEDVDGVVLHTWAPGEWARAHLAPADPHGPAARADGAAAPPKGSREEVVEALRPFGEAYLFAMETFKGEAWAQWEASVAEAGLALEDMEAAAGIVGEEPVVGTGGQAVAKATAAEVGEVGRRYPMP